MSTQKKIFTYELFKLVCVGTAYITSFFCVIKKNPLPPMQNKANKFSYPHLRNKLYVYALVTIELFTYQQCLISAPEECTCLYMKPMVELNKL